MPTYGTLELDPVRDAAFQTRLTRLREQWVEQVTTLVRQAEEWAIAAKDAHGWTVERETQEIEEEVVGGAYTVPGLRLNAGGDELRLEPIARGVLHADGRVDLYAWPSLFRVMLLRKNDKWVVRTESGLDWPQVWNQETFLTLADGLLRAE
jgi:hypothetical protein